MIDLATLSAFFGWCTVINIAILMLAMITLSSMRGTIIKIHSGMFGVDADWLPGMYFKYLAYLKIAVIVFNFTPWLAIQLMS